MLSIQFVARTRVYREVEESSGLPVVQNGPPGTFVVFADGARVSLPTDQVVSADDSSGSARVAFGGMKFSGIEDGELVFYRTRDLQAPEKLSPQRGVRMTLDPKMVAAVHESGHQVWPHG
jgi:hypothetical protein